MKQIRGLDKWLTDDEDHQDWVWDELIKIEYMPSNITDTRDLKILVNEALNKLATTPDGHIYIAEIRKKWSRKKFNDNKNNKSTSVTLSPSALKNLDFLAKGKTRRQVLEELLSTGADFQKISANLLSSKIKVYRAKFEQKLAVMEENKKQLEAEINCKNNEINKLNEEILKLTAGI